MAADAAVVGQAFKDEREYTDTLASGKLDAVRSRNLLDPSKYRPGWFAFVHSSIIQYAESAESPFTAEPCRQERRTLRMTDVWMPAAVSCWHRAVRRMITMNGIFTPIPFGGAQV